VLGEYGDGSDGVVNFDGTTTILGLVPSSGVYTLTRDIFLAGGSQVSGSAVIKCANYRIFCNGTFTIGASAIVQNDGVFSGGATSAGTLLANTGGGIGNTGATGSAGSSPGNALGGASGASGASSGGPGTGGGRPAVSASVPATTASLPRAVSLAHTIANAFTRWGGGASGSGGDAAASSTGGGGGAGGNVLEMRVYNLVASGLIRSAGAAGNDAIGSGTGAGGGGGGGGGVLILIYHTKSGAGSTFTAATNTPGGAGGAPQGAGKTGATGSNGNIYEIVL
jgi:hypothetical protein